jgi:hypothetical protein
MEGKLEADVKKKKSLKKENHEMLWRVQIK